jgi:hypothetical protein
MKKSWCVAVTLAVLLSGCFVMNIKPPYADPANPVPHAVIVPGEDPAGAVKVGLLAVDGRYANYEPTVFYNATSGGHFVDKMLVLPGRHSVLLWCSLMGSDVASSVDLEFDLEADKRYVVTCMQMRDGRHAKFQIRDEDGRDVPYVVKKDHMRDRKPY